jgi:DNA-binding MarR family transcriptional regulator
VKRPAPAEPWRHPALGPCACSELRRTSRAVSALYDRFLAASGLTVTQYAILAAIGRADGSGRTALAAKLGMERTTLSRNLRPLEREGLFSEEPGADRRGRALRLTAAGKRRLARSFLLWEKAQRAFRDSFGPDRYRQLRVLLAGAAQASETARSSPVLRRETPAARRSSA